MTTEQDYRNDVYRHIGLVVHRAEQLLHACNDYYASNRKHNWGAVRHEVSRLLHAGEELGLLVHETTHYLHYDDDALSALDEFGDWAMAPVSHVGTWHISDDWFRSVRQLAEEAQAMLPAFGE